MVDDGVIKFHFSEFIKTEPIDSIEYQSLEKTREKLFSLKLIGEYLPEEIGFGNLSLRQNYSDLEKTSFPQFLITGTQTGKFKNLDGNHYTRVVDGSLEKQSIACHGPVQASSESLTHAGIYRAASNIQAIVHVHHALLWEKMLKGDYPKTKIETAYGTSEMAEEVASLIKLAPTGIFVMAGHQDGIVFYASSLEKATELALDTYHLLMT
jgi:ribulose-5-phosphate 4-epimerase/fuculose-1-phosphate aldolase